MAETERIFHDRVFARGHPRRRFLLHGLLRVHVLILPKRLSRRELQSRAPKSGLTDRVPRAHGRSLALPLRDPVVRAGRDQNQRVLDITGFSPQFYG